MTVLRSITLRLRPEEMEQDNWLVTATCEATGIDEEECFPAIRKQSIDARKRQVFFELHIDLHDAPYERKVANRNLQDVSSAAESIVIGTGPAGLFAAIRLIELGLKPILIDRGKDVQTRRRDLAKINKEGIVNADSNYCFGEGGAGTYSDGKLYTRSGKRGDVNRILETLVQFGATPQILIDSHPHIGTNKLPNVIASIRQTILDHGGEIHFEKRLTDLLTAGGRIVGIECADGSKIKAQSVILATGHSARDVYDLLHQKKITISAKPFAIGVRVEHGQQLIDQIQYKCPTVRHPLLPAAAYALVAKDQQRGMFSFCMCPGGFIVPAATASGEVVVNGMSPSRRDSKFANSGIVISVDQNDYQSGHPLAGVEFQRKIEQAAYVAGGSTLAAPGQRLTDFVDGKVSSTLPESSYQPGLSSTDLTEVLPKTIAQTLKSGLIEFGRKLPGYLTNEAVLVGVESRTSSPVKIPRDRISLQHPEVIGLFPCGEGAGYAGGIVSAAMDGEACANAVSRFVKTDKH